MRETKMRPGLTQAAINFFILIFIFKIEFSERLYSVETNQTVTSRVNLPRFRDYLLLTNGNRAFNLLRFT